MRLTLLAIPLALLALAAPAAAVGPPTPKSYTIKVGESIGGVMLGKSMASGKAAWGSNGVCATLLGASGESCLYEVESSGANYNTGNGKFNAGKTGKIVQVSIDARYGNAIGTREYVPPMTKFKTNKGVKLGSSLTKVKSAYPKVKRISKGQGFSAWKLAGPGNASTTFSFFADGNLGRIVITSGAASGSVARASAIKLSVKENFAVRLPAPSSPVDVYDVGEDASGFCAKGAGFPIAAGWTGTQTIVASILYRTGDTPYFNLDLRRPMTAGSFQAISLCAKGKGLGATVKTGSGQTVSCGKKLAIGVPAATSWPYEETPIVAEPSGPKAWKYVQTRGTPTAVCVNASAFSKVKVVKKKARFAVGSATATFSATCPGGRRAIGWGYTAGVMDQNVWESADTDSKVAVPFVSESRPNGTGWKITFTTPDQQNAKTAGEVSLNVTCAVPS